MGPEINSEELVPWCERRGIDASEIIAREPERWRASDGIHYLLRRYRPSPADGAIVDPEVVEVVAPFDDPKPPIYKMEGRAVTTETTMTQEALLDLISAHADAYAATVLAVRGGGGAAEDEARSSLWLQVISAVRSLPIEAGR